MDLAAIRQIGRYRLTEIIGQGGMGIVYRGVDESIDRPVAIKMLLGGYGGDKDLLARFHREARSTGNLQHKNIVTVYALDDFEGFPYMVMEYLDGQSLSQLISSRRKFHIVEKLRLISQVCEGLQYAHDQKIIHRDIKPANIIVLKDGTAKIVDFGIARISRNETETLTHTGQIIGSLYYMSPEQFRGDGSVDARTDIYSTGVTLFQFLTGELPFQSADGDHNKTIFQILNEPVPSLSKYLQNLPADLDAIVSRAMAKDPDQRYQAAEDLGYDLSRMQETLKEEMLSEFLSDAKAAIAQNDFETARQRLQEALKFEKRDPEANRLFQFVRDQLLKQQRSAQVANLQSQARMALAEMHYEMASAYIEQARRLDPDNQELVNAAQSIQNQIALARELEEALRRGQAALISGDLDGASQAVQRALEIDNSHTEARSLDGLIRKELEERAKRARLQGFIEQARREISDRNYLSALRSLESACAIDPADSHVRELLSWAQRGHEQDKLRNQLRKYLDDVTACIAEKRLTDALRTCDEALGHFPDDASILKLQAIARHHHVIAEQRQTIEAAYEKARGLTDENRPEEAISFLEETLKAFPEEPTLLALLANTRSERERRIKEAQEREHQLGELARGTAPIPTAEQTRKTQVLSLLTELQARLNQRAPMCHLSEAASRVKGAVSLHGIEEARVSVVLSEFESRFAKWKKDASELDEIARSIEHSTALAPIDLLVERARFLRGLHEQDDEITERYNIVRASAEQLKRDWNQANTSCLESLQSMQATENLNDLQGLHGQMQKTAARWIEDPAILSMLNQAAERVDDVRKRKEQVLEQLGKIRSSLATARSSGQVRLLQEQAQMVVAVFRDAAVDHFLEGLILAANERKSQIEEVLTYLRELAAMVDNARSIEEIERCHSDTATWLKREDLSEEARELLKRTQRQCQDRKQDYRQTQENLERLVSSAETAADLAELDLIQAQRRDLLRLHPGDITLHGLEARFERSLTHRREVLQQMAAEQSAPADASEQPVLNERPQVENHAPVVEPKEPLRTVRGRRGLLYAGGGITLAVIGTAGFVLSPKVVFLRANPSDAVVTIDGQPCSNPCSRKLTHGTHNLTVSRPGFTEVRKTIEVGWLGATIPSISLDPAPKPTEIPSIPPGNPEPGEANQPELVIQTSPGAMVFLDDSRHPIGVTDARGQLDVKATAGNHQVRVEKDGYEKPGAETVSVKGQGKTFAFFNLKAQPLQKPLEQGSGPQGAQETNLQQVPVTPPDTYLVVHAPTGAEIHVDQQIVGHSAGGPLKIKVQPGTRIVEVILAGYQSFTESVSATAGQENEIFAKLTPVPATNPPISEAFPKPPAVSTVSDDDRRAIQQLLDRYADGYSHKNLRAIESSWPSIPAEAVKKIKEFFKLSQGVDMKIRLTNATPASKVVTVDYTQTLRYSLDGKEVTDTATKELYVVKTQGGWLIDFIPMS